MIPALTLINDAAIQVGDPNFERIPREVWRSFLNRACRDHAKKVRLVRWVSVFDVVAGDEEYGLPTDTIQIVSVQFNPAPLTNPGGWLWLREKFEDEYRDVTNGSMPTGEARNYTARPTTLNLYPQPATAVTGGGKIAYWGLPDAVTDEGTQSLPLMDMLQDSVTDRMLVLAHRRLKNFDSASEYDKEWQATLTFDRDRIEDRSADRRPKMRPGPRWTGER